MAGLVKQTRSQRNKRRELAGWLGGWVWRVDLLGMVQTGHRMSHGEGTGTLKRWASPEELAPAAPARWDGRPSAPDERAGAGTKAGGAGALAQCWSDGG